MKRTPNEPCWCGSGLKYKHCHRDIDGSSKEEFVGAARRVYARNWRKNAQDFVAQGCYQWMSSLLFKYSPKKILDVGCGEGSHIISMLKCGSDSDIEILSLEENPECINKSIGNLENAGCKPAAIRRMQVVAQDEKNYYIGIEQGKLTKQSNILLVEADILLDDSDLLKFLGEMAPFDAVTVWLIGTHMARQNCLNLAQLNIRSNGEYRLRVQNKIYEISDMLLRPGGILQIVDRTEVPDEESKEDFMRAHKEQASVTSLVVKEIDHIIYNESEGARRVTMKPTLGTSGQVRDLSRVAMTSIISQKPGAC